MTSPSVRVIGRILLARINRVICYAKTLLATGQVLLDLHVPIAREMIAQARASSNLHKLSSTVIIS